ncbi:XkdQ/YqbQ family protein [Paenibacillus sp. NPDC093718]|uniref:XkdQ/YqbQ family protein n=1 Tax=Paenibacillus sp. NPDC093718 TaxID=3390601 RepID=UPI003CFFBDDF
MSHTLLLITDSKTIDITPIVGNVRWSSHVDTLGQSLEFEVAYSDTKFFPKNPCDLGHMVVLKNGARELYRGIIIRGNESGRNPISYESLDLAVYLNESTSVYQFKKINAKQAITKVLSDFIIPIGSIDSMPTLIKKIYIEETPATIITDIIEQVEKDVGYKFRMEMRAGKMYIVKRKDLVVSGTFRLSTNLPKNSVTDAISEPTRSRSIQEMRNSIKIVLQGEKDSYSIKATAKNQKLIDQYGLLEHTETIEKTDVAKAKNIANNRLKELGRIFEDNTMRLIGHDDFIAGRLIEINEPVTGMRGKYLIKSVTHVLEGAQHYMDVSLGVDV